jgi:cysteine desulfurase
VREVYLDGNASAPLRPQARDALAAALDLGPGNASSPHAAGRRLRKLLGDAREAIASLVGADPHEVVFTSGATEANALAIHGLLAATPGALATTRAEHPSVARAAERAASRGAEVRWAGVGRWGRWDAAELVRAADGAAVVAATLAQSVTGALEPVARAGAALSGASFHVDAAQALGRVPVDVKALGASTLAVSGHKIGGPHGVGALVVRRGTRWTHPLAEGTQEMGRRGGTEAVALIAAFGAAATAVRARGAEEAARMAKLLEQLRDAAAAMPGAQVLSPAEDALPNTLLVAFEGCAGDAVMAALDARGIRVSTGSACASGARVPPEVLLAAGASRADAARAVRVSLSWASEASDVAAFAGALPEVLARVRGARATS